MKLVKCAACGNQVSNQAAACPGCGHPVAKQSNHIGGPFSFLLIIIVSTIVIFWVANEGSGGGSLSAPASAKPKLDAASALTMCQFTIKNLAKDPETARVPYVANMGKGQEFHFAWGRSTKFARMRNGLGLEVPVSASCIVDGNTKRITMLTMDGKTII